MGTINKHISVIWSNPDAVKLEHEGANRGGGVLAWPLDRRLFKLKLKLKMISDDDVWCYIQTASLKL
jgi:hypothetical protein